MKERCKEILARAYLYLDGEGLSDPERLEIEAHLEECAPCLERYGFEREVTFLLTRLRHLDRCPDALRMRVTRLLEQP